MPSGRPRDFTSSILGHGGKLAASSTCLTKCSLRHGDLLQILPGRQAEGGSGLLEVHAALEALTTAKDDPKNGVLTVETDPSVRLLAIMSLQIATVVVALVSSSINLRHFSQRVCMAEPTFYSSARASTNRKSPAGPSGKIDRG
jgi:hypothetical protein